MLTQEGNQTDIFSAVKLGSISVSETLLKSLTERLHCAWALAWLYITSDHRDQ